MAFFRTEKQQETGIALGGIGTGSVELRPDGEFHCWQIANQSRWGGQCDEWEMDDGEQYAGALSFWTRCKDKEGNVIVRKLGMKTSSDDFTYRMYAWNKPVEAIEYDGHFPTADLKYIDKALPMDITMKATAPFVPHHSDYSAIPGFTLDFEIANNADKELEISLLGAIEPSFANQKRCKNSLLNDNGITAVKIAPAAQNDAADTGNLCFSVSGNGESSYITADYFRFLREFVSHSQFGITQESFLFGFRESGVLPDTDIGYAPEKLTAELSSLSDGEIERKVNELSKYPMALAFLARIRHLNPDYPTGRKEQESFLRYMARQIHDIGDDFGSAALCKNVTLKKGEHASVRFCLSWYFPNHFSRLGPKMGHYYENLYHDSYEANIALVTNKEITEKANAFADLLRTTDAPECYPEGWSAHLSTIVKSSWWLKNGKFGLWEGLGKCGFHTTDITYHASFGLISLFPELQLGQMRMGAAFQREDGRVHHFLTPDLEHDDGGFDRVDMNPQFVLMVARDYLFTGNRTYLDDMWQHVTAAMDSISSLDTNSDALPDQGTGQNTYDAWRFSGTPAYISILWLAALKAASFLAGVVGDIDRAENWNTMLETGKASLENLLWNGDYYDLWRSDERSDGSLMTDQLDGEWFLRMSGIGGNLPDERVRNVLSFIWDHNFDPDDGLVNATCPNGKQTTMFTYLNCQAQAVWTGIGYAFAALALSVGMPQEIAEREIRSIHENQSRLGMFWSHWECGAYYTRPLSSWSTLIALTGMKLNSADKTLTLSPLINGKLPLCTPNFIGTINVTENECAIDRLEGSLEGWNISAGGRQVTVI